MHRLPGHSKPAQLFLPFWAELRGFGGRQMPGATGFSGCGAALAAQFGEAGHDGRDSSPCWRNLRLVLGFDVLHSGGARVHLAHPLGVRGFRYRRVK
jgi:hypothetical protein